MKQITVDNTVKDVLRWAAVVGKLAENLMTVKSKDDAIETARILKGQTPRRSVIWKNIKKYKVAPQLSPTWVRDVLKNITDEIEIEDKRSMSEFSVPLHKKRSCLVVLLAASKVKLEHAINVMDRRIWDALSSISSANERLQFLDEKDLSSPLLSEHMTDELDPKNGGDAPVRTTETGGDTEGQPNTPEC